MKDKQRQKLQIEFDHTLLEFQSNTRSVIYLIHIANLVIALLAFVMDGIFLLILMGTSQYIIVLLKGKVLLENDFLARKTMVMTKNLYFPVTKKTIIKSKCIILVKHIVFECFVSTICVFTMLFTCDLTRIKVLYAAVLLGIGIATIQLIISHHHDLNL